MRHRSAIQYLYGHVASHYEQDVLPFFAPLAESLISIIPEADLGGHVLDVGTGTGIIPQLITGRVQYVTGIDIVPEMINIARGSTHTPNVDYLVADIQQPPLRYGSFDLVTSSFGLNLTQPRPALRRLFALLKPGGWLAVQEWGPSDPASQLFNDIFADFVPDEVAETIRERLALPMDWGDQLQDAADYRELLSDLGYLNIEAVEETLIAIHVRSMQSFINFKSAWMPYQLTLQALNELTRTDLFNTLYHQLTPFADTDGSFIWRPAVFRVLAQRPA